MLLKAKRNLAQKDMQTFIGPKTILKGNIRSMDIISIQGILNGDIVTDDDLTVGNSGQLTGNMTAKSIQIGGRVDGNIIAENTVRMLPSAKVCGNLLTKGLIIEEGAFYYGKCNMKYAADQTE